MTHTKVQLLTPWNHRVTVSQRASCLGPVNPVGTLLFRRSGGLYFALDHHKKAILPGMFLLVQMHVFWGWSMAKVFFLRAINPSSHVSARQYSCKTSNPRLSWIEELGDCTIWVWKPWKCATTQRKYVCPYVISIDLQFQLQRWSWRAGDYFEISDFEYPRQFFEIVIPDPWSSYSVASYNELTPS